MLLKRLYNRVKTFFVRLIRRVQTYVPRRPSIEGAKQFVIKTARRAYTAIFNFAKSFIDHWETIAIIVLATIGLTALLAQMEWLMVLNLPFWIEPQMVLPVISSLIIWHLMRSAEWHRKRRQNRVIVLDEPT